MKERHDCDAITELWIQLNPHVAVHGCEVDPSGSVFIYVLYSRNKKQHPLELNIGNPASAVIRALKKAVQAQGRQSRLIARPDSQIRSSGETRGNSTPGEVDGRDK